MKSFLIFFFLIIFSVIFFVTPTYAQLNPFNMNENTPGLGCGIPNDLNGADKCCAPATISCSTLIPSFLLEGPVNGVISSFPVLGQLISGYTKQCVETTQNIDLYQKKVTKACIYGDPSLPNDLSNPSCTCQSNESNATASAQLSLMCYRYLQNSEDLSGQLSACLDCTTKGKMWSGIGCIPLSLQGFITEIVFSMGIGLGGFVALLCIIYSAISIQTSQGNPEKIKKAQENMTSCITGLILIIFSVFLLRFIGVDILQIPFLE